MPRGRCSLAGSVHCLRSGTSAAADAGGAGGTCDGAGAGGARRSSADAAGSSSAS